MRRLPVLPAEVPTASRVGLGMRCTYPWTSGQRATARSAGVEAQVGTVVHSAAEAAIRGEDTVLDMTRLPADTAMTAWDLVEVVRAFVEEERCEPHIMYAAEVPVEIDLLTGAGRTLPSSGQRDYGARSPHGIAGTADVLLWPEGGRPTVRDWKTGMLAGMAREAARVQVRTLAVAVAAIYEVDEVVTEIASVATDGVRIDREVLRADTLDAHIDALWSLAGRLGSGPRPPSPGPWCAEMHCPLLGECPASRGALVAVTAEEPIARIADDATALRAIAAIPRAEAALNAVREALHNYIRRSPPIGPDGRRYGFVEHSRRHVDVSTPERRLALERVLGVFVGDAVVVEYSTSIEGIKRAARRKLSVEKRSRGITGLTEQALIALTQAGGVRTHFYQKPEWFRPEGSTSEDAENAALMDELFGPAE